MSLTPINNPQNDENKLSNQFSPSIEYLEYRIKLDKGEVISHFIQKSMRLIEEGIKYFNAEVTYIKKLMQGIALDIKDRHFFKKDGNDGSIKNWITFKAESYQFSVTHLARGLNRLAEEIMPGFDSIISILFKKLKDSDDPVDHKIYQSVLRFYRLKAQRQREIAEVMAYLLTCCMLENKLSLITKEQFILFTNYIAKYSFENTQGKLLKLLNIDKNEKNSAFKVDIKNQQWVLTIEGCSKEVQHVNQIVITPQQSLFASILPGASVYNDFLPSQFYVIARINTSIRAFKDATLSAITKCNQEEKLSPSNNVLQDHFGIARHYLSEPLIQRLSTIKILAQKNDHLKSQNNLIQNAIKDIEEKKLKGIGLIVATVFRHNPNKILDQWKDIYQLQLQQLMEQKIRLFQDAIAYAKTFYDSDQFSLPDASLIKLLREQAKELEEDQWHKLVPTSKEKIKQLYDEYMQVVDVTHYYISCIQNEDHIYLLREGIEKDGLTISIPSAVRLAMLTSRVLKYEQGEKGEVIKLISDWVRGESLPDSLSKIKNVLKPLFINREQDLEQFTSVLIEKYIKKCVTSVYSDAFKLVQEYDLSFAEEWVRERQQKAIDASFFLDRLFASKNQLQEAIVIRHQRILPTVSNAIQQAKLLKALSYRAQGFIDYWCEFKKSLLNRLVSKNCILYSNMEFSDFISSIDDDEITVYYGNKLLDILLETRDKKKLLGAKCFYEKHLNHQALQAIIQQKLKNFIHCSSWDPFIYDIIEQMGQIPLKQAYRMKWVEEMLFNGEFYDDDKEDKLGKSADDIIAYYGEGNIPQFIALIEKFFNQHPNPNHQGFLLINQYLTPEFIQKCGATKLSYLIKKYRHEVNDNQTIQADINRIIGKLRQAQLTCHPERIDEDIGEEIKSGIKAIFHRVLLHKSVAIEHERGRSIIATLLEKFAMLLHELAKHEDPKIIQAWQDKFDFISHPQPAHESRSILRIPPFPQPYIWLFVDAVRSGLKEMGVSEADPLLQQFNSMYQQFYHLTQVSSYFIEKIQDTFTITQEQQQANNGLVIYLPHAAELKELVEYVMQQPLSTNEVEAIQLLQKLLDGSCYPSSLLALKEPLHCLFANCPQAEAAENQFIKILFNRYVIPSLTSIHSSGYHLLKEYDIASANDWYEKNIPLVEESLYFIKEIFKPGRAIGDYAQPILCSGKKIAPSIDNIKQHLQRIVDFSCNEMNYLTEAKKLAGEYVNFCKLHRYYHSAHHAILTTLNDDNLIVEYGLNLIKFMLEQAQFALIIQHPFFVANRRNQILQEILAKECAYYFDQHKEWNSGWVELLSYFNQGNYYIGLLSRLVASQNSWHQELQKLTDDSGNVTLQKAYRLRCLAMVLADAEGASGYAGEYHLSNASELLETFYGEDNIPEVIRLIELFIHNQSTHGLGIKLIDAYLNEVNVKQYQLDAIHQQWVNYKKSLFRDKELDDQVAGIVKDLEYQHYKSAISKLNLILENAKRYPEGTPQHAVQLAIFGRIMVQLEILVKKWINLNLQQGLALLESYFIALIPDSKRKIDLMLLCQEHHPDYQFDRGDELSLTLFSIYSYQLENFDQQLFSKLQTEYPHKEHDSCHLRLKSIRDRMVLAKVPKVRSLVDLVKKDKAVLRLSERRLSFFRQDNTVEAAIDISVKAHLLRDNIGKKSNRLRSIDDFFEEVRDFDGEILRVGAEKIKNKAIKGILFGLFNDGFFSEFPELILQEYSPASNMCACQNALRAFEDGSIKLIKDFGILRSYGDSLRAAGRYRRAIYCYEQALIVNPNDIYIHRQNIIAKFYSKKYHDVVKSINEVIKLNIAENDRHILIYYRAQAYQELGDLSKALIDTEFLKKKKFQINTDEYSCPAMNGLMKR